MDLLYGKSDQLPQTRNVDHLLELAMNANSLVIPHRGECRWHPQDVADHALVPPDGLNLKSVILRKELHPVDDIMSASCCFNQSWQDISEKTFTPFDNASVKLFRQHESFV
jgi:hypothetical protein